MADDTRPDEDTLLDEAFARLTALTDEQLANLDHVTGMDDDGLAAFQQRIDMAWGANQQAVQDAKAVLATRRRAQADIEERCGTAARARYMAAGGQGLCTLNDDEKAQVLAARAQVDDAVAALEAAMARFKDGVTADQLAAELPGGGYVEVAAPLQVLPAVQHR